MEQAVYCMKLYKNPINRIMKQDFRLAIESQNIASLANRI